MATDSTAIQKVEAQLSTSLAVLSEMSKSIVVRDANSYREAGEGKLEAQNYVKRVGHELDAGIYKAKEVYDYLRNQKAKFVDPAKEIIASFDDKMVAYRTEEKRLAEIERQKEQDRLRKEQEAKAETERKERESEAEKQRKIQQAEIEKQRKAGELNEKEAERLKKQVEEEERKQKEEATRQAEEMKNKVPVVEVKPNIVAVAGSKNQTHYKFEIVDRRLVFSAFMCPDLDAIGKKVRADKDPAKSMKEIGGIRAWGEG